MAVDSAEETRAVQLYRAALSRRPALLSAQHELADLLLRLDRYDEAIKSLQTDVRRFPNDATLQRDLGGALALVGDTDGAEQYLRRAIELEPKDYVAYRRLGFLLMQLDRVDEAVGAFRRAAKLEPDNAERWYELARACHRADQPVAAYDALQEALRLNPRPRRRPTGAGPVAVDQPAGRLSCNSIARMGSGAGVSPAKLRVCNQQDGRPTSGSFGYPFPLRSTGRGINYSSTTCSVNHAPSRVGLTSGCSVSWSIARIPSRSANHPSNSCFDDRFSSGNRSYAMLYGPPR